MKNTFKRISILASAFLMALTSSITAMSASGADRTVDLTSGYAEETINLSDAEAIAGNQVMVKLSLNTGNQCMGYDLDIEFDSSLTLLDVKGATTWEANGNVVTIIGFSANGFEDGEDVATLYFETPENAAEGASYDIGVKNVADLVGSNSAEITDYDIDNSTVKVVESAKRITNHVVVDGGALGLRGDANNDGSVNVLDAIKIAKYIVGTEKLKVNETRLADVNGNNSVDLLDAIAISRYILVAAGNANAWELALR